MRGWLRVRLTAEVLLGLISLGLAILTTLNGEWIEALTGLEPDQGSGALEWAITLDFAAVAGLLGALAVRHRGRRRSLRSHSAGAQMS